MSASRGPVYSVIIPVYNEEQVVAACHRELGVVMKSLDDPYELIFVDDGSRDRTFPILYGITRRDPAVRIVNFSRNFGHQAAISAGLDHARGEAAVIIDADLQDPPAVIRRFVKKWKQGYEVVYGERTARARESFFKRCTAKLFYRLLSFLSGTAIPRDAGDFRLLDKKVYTALRRMPERHRFMRGLSSWVGYRQCAVKYERAPRAAGKTKYPLWKMFALASDAITSFSMKPLKIAGLLGLLTAAAGFMYLLYSFIRFLTGAVVEGWMSLVALLIIFNGISFMVLGIMGNYIGRIYEEVKARPLYIVRETIGFTGSNDDTPAPNKD